MRYLLLIGLVLVGCGKGEEKATTSSEKTRFTPSELLAMKELPQGEIVVVGKVAMADGTKKEATMRKVTVVVEDDVISTKEKNQYVYVVFESDDKDFSQSFVDWVKRLNNEKSLRAKGKLLRGNNESIFIYDAELQ